MVVVVMAVGAGLWALISGSNCEVKTASAIDLVVTMPV